MRVEYFWGLRARRIYYKVKKIVDARQKSFLSYLSAYEFYATKILR